MQKLDPKSVWLFFVHSILAWGVVAGVFAGYTVFLFFLDIEEGVSVFLSLLWWLLLIIAVFLFLAFIWAKLSYHFYRYELREDGFRKELGVIWKKYVTIPYDRIQNVDIRRGIIARLLGLSDVYIQTAGASAQYSRYGARGLAAEGMLPGLSREKAEQIRDELIQRARQSKNQGL